MRTNVWVAKSSDFKVITQGRTVDEAMRKKFHGG